MSVSKYRFVIPTRNSSKWIKSFLLEYRKLGIEPLFLLDRRSIDNTGSILSSMNALCISVSSRHSRVESIIYEYASQLSEQWIIRLDDDEIPSRQMIDWIDQNISSITSPSICFSRRDAFLKGGELFYSKSEAYYWLPDHYDYLNPQWRAFQPSLVEFSSDIHTPGFIRGKFALAPEEAFFVHFDWIVRDFGERVRKLINYENQHAGGGLAFARFYLPEVIDEHSLRPSPLPVSTLVSLAKEISNNDFSQTT